MKLQQWNPHAAHDKVTVGTAVPMQPCSPQRQENDDAGADLSRP